MTNEKIMSTICDSICRHPYRVESQAELDILCEDCVVNKLEASDGDLISRADAIHTVRNSEVLLSYDSEWSCDVLAESAIDQTRDCLTHALKALPSAEADCSTCKHKDKDWDSEECDSCCGNNSHYASAEAVQGEWVRDKETEKDNELIYHKVWTCPFCGEQQVRPKPSNFCHNCGARMYKGGDDE